MSETWRILIVEDEEGLRRSLRVFLEDEGFEVATSASGEDGLVAFQSFKPHASVVDMRLPGIDGNSFILKALTIHPTARFVICTGSTLYELSHELMAIGLNKQHVLRKPLRDMSVMSNLLKTILERGA